MWITTKSTIGFVVPDEYELMCKFKAEHPDYKEEQTTGMIYFSKELTAETRGRRKVLFGSGIEFSDTSNIPKGWDKEIIHCKDCKHWLTRNGGYCEIWEQYISNDAFYCGCGRKTGGEENVD